MTRPPLALPLKAEANRPIYDANGKLVSITDHADVFARIANERAAILILMERLVGAARKAAGPDADINSVSALLAYAKMAEATVSLARKDETVTVPYVGDLANAIREMHDDYYADRQREADRVKAVEDADAVTRLARMDAILQRLDAALEKAGLE